MTKMYNSIKINKRKKFYIFKKMKKEKNWKKSKIYVDIKESQKHKNFRKNEKIQKT